MYLSADLIDSLLGTHTHSFRICNSSRLTCKLMRVGGVKVPVTGDSHGNQRVKGGSILIHAARILP